MKNKVNLKNNYTNKLYIKNKKRNNKSVMKNNLIKL